MSTPFSLRKAIAATARGARKKEREDEKGKQRSAGKAGSEGKRERIEKRIVDNRLEWVSIGTIGVAVDSRNGFGQSAALCSHVSGLLLWLPLPVG